ncbi:MAG: hypothetical protein IBX64_00475 [Actinobacteria bacterium]|nr:hypothetical protein [Actinomycetota bacterium]
MIEPEQGYAYWVGDYIPSAGLSINSYLIVDDYPTLINTGAPITIDTLINKVESVIKLTNIEYIVLTNADIAYAGGLPRLLEIAPQARVIASAHEAMRLGLYGIYIQPLLIQDGDMLNIGKATLQFYSAPFIGSPGSVFIFDATSGILFSGEAFSTTVSAWQILTEEDMTELLQAYFNVNIGDSATARDAISRLKMLDIKLLAPGHGPMMRRHIDRYIGTLSGGYAEAA